MQSSADNSSGVTRLNHFISVSRDNRREMREAGLEERGTGRRRKEKELALLVFKRDTFKAVIMTQRECNYFPRMPEGSECLLIVMGGNLIDHRCRKCMGLNWRLNVSSLSEHIPAFS